MTFVTILAISLLVGLVATGLTWYGLSACENVLASFRHARESAREQDKSDAEAKERDGGGPR
ncbi:MAG: hypothetical protein JXR94_04850 [Candidatus Hydrogenedentes bacterium]|nr:hypothetical protein [Candidatus Hydrogenedentota bacterium]